MAFGAVGESFRRVTGSGDGAGRSLMLSAGNMERLVAKLSKMRGAALKLGQMMSFQGLNLSNHHKKLLILIVLRHRLQNAPGTDQ